MFALKRRKIVFDAQKAKAQEQRMLRKMADVEYPIGKNIRREFFEPKKRKRAKPRVEPGFICAALGLKQVDLETLFRRSKLSARAALPPVPRRPGADKENPRRGQPAFRIKSNLAWGEQLALREARVQEKFRELQGVRNLEIFDYFEEALSPEEWVAQCRAEPGKAHARTPVFRDHKYVWVQVEVLDYSPAEKTFHVRELPQGAGGRGPGQKRVEKWVRRLSLCFDRESFEDFALRIQKCKQFMASSKNQSAFEKFVEKVEAAEVSRFPQKFKNRVYQKVFPERASDAQKKQQDDLFYDMILEVEAQFAAEMKKLRVLDRASQSDFRRRLEDKKVDLRRVDPFFREDARARFQNHFLRKIEGQPDAKKLGLIGKMRKRSKFGERLEGLRAQKVLVSPKLLRCVQMFTARSAEFARTRLLSFEGVEKHPPYDLKSFVSIQEDRFKTNRLSLNSQWREQNIGDITDLLREMDQFAEAFKHEAVYNSPARDTLKRFLGRIDLKFKEGMLELLERNVRHYLDFLRRYCAPWAEEKEPGGAGPPPEAGSKPPGEAGAGVPALSVNQTTVLSAQRSGARRGRGEPLPQLSAQPLVFIQLKFSEQEKKKKDRKKKGHLIYLEPSLASMTKKLQAPLQWLAETVEEQQSMERDIVKMLNLPKKKLVSLGADSDFLRNARRKVAQMVKRGFREPKRILRRFKKFEFLLERSKEEFLKSFFDGKKVKKEGLLAKTERFLEKLETSIAEVGGICAGNFKGVFFEVRTADLKRFLVDKAEKVKEAFFKRITAEADKNITELQEKYNRVKASLTLEPQNEKEFTALRGHLRDLDRNMARLARELRDAASMLRILEKFNQKVDQIVLVHSWLLHASPLEIRGAFLEGQKIAAHKEEVFMSRLEEEKLLFLGELEGIEAVFFRFVQIDSLANIAQSAERNENLKDRIKEAVAKVQNFNERERLFKLERSEYFVLDKLQREFAPYRELWDVAFQFTNDREAWDVHVLFKLSFTDVVRRVDAHRRKIRELGRTFESLGADSAGKVVRQVQAEIQGFSKRLPVIEWLTKESIVKKLGNWKTLFAGLGLQSNPNSESLNSLMGQGILGRMDEVKEFVVKAEQEFSLEKVLNSKVLDVLKKTEVRLMEYPAQQTWLLEKPDEMQLMLDDLLSLIQSLKQSPFLRNLKRKVEEVERKLMGFQDLLQCWKACQRAWMYLEPIFVSEDLKKNMPLEKKLFDSVNASWKEIMGGVRQEPFVFETLDWERVKADLTNCNRDLDAIKKSLNNYLEEKRADFQRFYFLSDEELIEIISRTKDPTLVTKYLSKCFDAIASIEFDSRRRIVAFLSKQGERVPLLRPIDVEEGDKKGNVEKWLKELEANMKNTLRKLACEAVEDLGRDRAEWLAKWPGQIALMVNQVRWTSNVEQAILDKTLPRFEAQSKEELVRIVDLVRGDLEPTQRITLSALVTLDVHANHLVTGFIKKNLRSVEDFSYVSQLRYYLGRKDTVHCRMMTADYLYQFEYLGNTRRLVITPLTDRCFRTLIEAYHYFYGGAPEGPAGTGKTETVKELAKAVAVKCNVFNCTDQINFAAMSKIFKGLAQTGSWCCFDEFNLIAPEVLSVIAEQVRSIQNAIKERQSRFFFEGKNILLVRSCSVNITMNPGYSGRSALPDNLKALFRSCAMMIPNYSLIAEISLYSSGFFRASELSVKVVSALTLSSEQLSTQKHYDFGMRALNAILTAAANEKRAHPQKCELELCLKALHDANLPKFTRNDSALFRSITADLFPDVAVPKPQYSWLRQAIAREAETAGLLAPAAFTQKCIELYETLSVRHGLMLVGDTFSGKTCVLRTLQRALAVRHKVDVHTINPKAVTRPQLYGSLNPDNNVWTDGVFTAIMKLCESQSDEPEHKWLVFDGPVEAGWIESMNTLLDDNMVV